METMKRRRGLRITGNGGLFDRIFRILIIPVNLACPACPVAPADGTGVGPEDRTGVNPACPVKSLRAIYLGSDF